MTSDVRRSWINIIRGLCCLLVALFHFNEPEGGNTGTWGDVLKYGTLRVSLFFVISGYCMTHVRLRDGMLPFFGKRLLRIYAPYLASVALVLGVVAFRLLSIGVNDVTQLPDTPSAWIYTVLALPFPASSVPAVNWVYWTLTYELAFYLIIGLCLRRGNFLILTAATAAFIALPLFPFDRWGLFSLGCAAHLWVHSRRRESILLAALSLLHIGVRQGLPVALVGTAGALLLAYPPRFSLHRALSPFVAVGERSYSLYLIHVPIGCFVLSWLLPDLSGNGGRLSVLELALTLGLCLLVAEVFYRLVEKPSHELARRLFSRRTALRSASGSPAPGQQKSHESPCGDCAPTPQ